MNKDKTLFYLIIFFIGIPVGINALLSFLSHWLVLYFYTSQELGFLGEILPENYNLFSNTISFIVPTIMITLFCLPVFSYRIDENKREIACKRIVMSPLIVPFLAMSGWIITVLLHLAAVLFLSNSFLVHGSGIAIKFLFLPFLEAFLGFILCFYSMELMGRRFLIPRFFKGDEILNLPIRHFLKIRTRMMFFYYGAGLYPLVLLTGYTIKLIARGSLFPEIVPVLLLYAGVIPLSILLIFMNSRYLQKPLELLKNTVDRFTRGDYSVNLDVTSRDEIGHLTSAVNRLGTTMQEREMMNETLGKVVDPAVRDHLLKGNLNLGGDYRMATILFSDIRDFTPLSERMQPDQLVRLLNRYFSAINRCIAEHRGVVNKYMGDAVMALFGVPVTSETHAEDAVRAALAMREARDRLNTQLNEEGLPVLKTGIGIHTGMIVAGNIGSEERMEFTVIGDTVNVASRLEGACKKAGKDLLISEETYQLAGAEGFRFIGSFKAKGRVEKVKVYSPV